MSLSLEKPKKKREDLQGIRGVAIISVILFHFLPSIFPNGYIGVDEFFVLSGYLMCQLLINQKKKKKKKNKESSDICIFYIRRLKRILPLYFLILFLSIVSIFTLFPFESIHLNVISAKNAAFFISNRPKSQDEDYFQMLTSAMDVFTHTWSLSVEVQFYAIVPFLFLIGNRISDYSNRLEILFHLILGIASFTYSIVFCTKKEAFYSVPARIWQFSIGMITFLLSELQIKSGDLEEGEKADLLEEIEDEEEDQRENHSPKQFITVILLIGMFYPIEIPSEILRPGITVMTGILMVSNRKSILESRILTYFGDISYSLYLIHWPIYAFWKSNYSQNDTWNTPLFIALALSILLAIISYHSFEKWYLSLSTAHNLILCAILFSINMGILEKVRISNWNSPVITNRLDGLNNTGLLSYEEAAEMNKKWSADDIYNLRVPSCDYESLGTAFGVCRHKLLNTTTGKYKLMMIGNSWAPNHGTIVFEECGYKAKSLVQVAVSACESIYNTTDYRCNNSVEMFREKVKNEQPDYLFIFSRFINIGDPMTVTKIEDDPIYQEMVSNTEQLSKSVKYKIFIMHQIPRANLTMLSEIVDQVKRNNDLVAFDKSLIVRDAEIARLRYEKMVSGCPKCELFDYKPRFFNETTKTWRFYDERNHGLTYLTQGLHLSFHGLELIRPVIRDICIKI